MGHQKRHALNAADHEAGTNGTLLGTESNAVAEKAFGTAATASAIVQRGASGQVTLPVADPVSDTDATSKRYVDEQVVSGNTWKELLLASEQVLNGGSGGVLQAILATIAVNLAAADTFIITDGTTTETYAASAGAPVGFQFQVGGSIAATLANLVASINANSVLWSAIDATGLDAYFTGAQANQAVIYRKTTQAGAAADRVYGVIASAQSDVQVVEFASGDQDYRQDSGTQSDLPSVDPAAKRFGFERIFASLNGGDTHRIAEDNTAFTWDSDDSIWQQTSQGSAVVEGDGIDITANKVSTDVATATVEQQYGGLVKNRTGDGTGAASADAGFNAIKTDNVDLAIGTSNEVKIKAASRLDKYRTDVVWESTAGGDREPDLAELNAALGTTNADRGNKVMLYERSTDYGQVLSVGGAGGVGSTSSFWATKIANNGVLADYHLVEMD